MIARYRSQFLVVGLVIRHHREKQTFTQEAFAADQHMSQSYYGAVERGKHNMTLWNYFHIAEGLGVASAQLLREADQLDLAMALKQSPRPPRRGRPPGSGRHQR